MPKKKKEVAKKNHLDKKTLTIYILVAIIVIIAIIFLVINLMPKSKSTKVFNAFFDCFKECPEGTNATMDSACLAACGDSVADTYGAAVVQQAYLDILTSPTNNKQVVEKLTCLGDCDNKYECVQSCLE